MVIYLEHLSTEEIIKYATASKINKETLELLSKVNSHIRTCSSCKEKVVAFEAVNDELKKEVTKNGFDLNHVNDLIKIKEDNVKEHY